MIDVDAVSLAAWAATLALNAGLALLIGAIASLIWSYRYQSVWSSVMRSQCSEYVRLGTVVVILASLLDLWSRSANAAGVLLGDAWSPVQSMLASSHYGRVWLVGMVVLLGSIATSLVGLERQGRRQFVRLGVIALAIAIFAWTRSLESHASADGDLSVSVVIEWIHLMLIALWVGIVFVASAMKFSQVSLVANEQLDVVAWISALSRAATIAVVGIVVTGVFNTWRATGGKLGELPGSTYGGILFMKLFFVFASICLGAHNRYRAMPSLLNTLRAGKVEVRTFREFTTVARIEAFTLAVALASAAVLSSTEPSAS